MEQITRILNAVDAGDTRNARDLLPLIYEELRILAAAKLNSEYDNHSLRATGLVHEAWMRIVGDDSENRTWNSRGHFFGAASEAMRRILIDHARANKALKRGGDRQRIELDTWNHPAASQPEQLLALDDALERLSQIDDVKAQLVKLRFFAGLTIKESASALNISTATAERYWTYARAWLKTEIQ